MNLTPKNKVILAAVGLLLLALVLGVVLVVPRIQRISTLDAEISTAEQEYSTAQSLLEQRRQIRDDAAVTDAGLIQLANAIPESPELPSLVIELQDLAYRLTEDNDEGILLQSVEPGEPTLPGAAGGAPQAASSADYVVIPVNLELYGSWSDTVEYLNSLTDTVRAVRIVKFDSSTLDLTAAEEAGIELPPYYAVRTLVTIEVYVIPPSDDADAAAPAVTPTPAQ